MDTRCSKRVILTRSKEDIERDRSLFENLGFEVYPLPLIDTEPISFELPDIKLDYIVFQSAKAVRYFLDKVTVSPDTRIVAVGTKTRKQVESYGYKVWKVPSENTARGIVDSMPVGSGEVVLVPRSEQGRTEVLYGLETKGYRVIPLNVYRTLQLKYSQRTILKVLQGGGFIVFASPSAVRAFFANLPKAGKSTLTKSLVIVAIGKTTKEILKEEGLEPDLVPSKPLMEEVAKRIALYWQENCKT